MASRARAVFAEHPRAEWLIPLACCLLLLTQMLCSVRQMSQHADEGVHLYAGYRALKCGDYTFGREHPPLAKMLVALPLLAGNPPLDCTQGGADIVEEQQATQWLYAQANWWHLLMEARAVSSLFAVALCLGVWIVARHMFDSTAAAVAAAMLAFEPNILGHGALLLNNVLLAGLYLFTVFGFYLWTRRRTAPLLVCTGLALGMALLTKHSAVLLILILFLLAVIEPWLEPGGETDRKRRGLWNLGAVAAMGLIAAATIWCAYGMHFSGGTRATEDDFGTIHSANVRIAKVMAAAHLLPKDYLYGLIDVHILVNSAGSGGYLLGQRYAQSPWYCLPVTMTIKFTLAFMSMLAMGGAGLILLGRERRRECVFLLLPALLFLLASLQIPRFIGIWHLFPMLPLLLIAATAGCVSLARRYRWAGGVLVCLLVLHAASSLRAYPHYLSYANEAWGGPGNLYKNLAWTDFNQTYWEISRYMEQHPNTPCWLDSDWNVPADRYKIPCVQMGNHWETELPAHMKGIVFVSSTWLQLDGFPGGPLEPFSTAEPKARLGGSAMLVYEGEFETRVLSARAFDNKVYRLLQAGDPGPALRPAGEAVQVSPSTATAHDLYCIALASNGYAQQSLWECSIAQKLALASPEAHNFAQVVAQHMRVIEQLSGMRIPPVVR